MRAGMTKWSKPIPSAMPGISTLDKTPPLLIKYLKTDGKKKKKIGLNARRFTRGLRDWEAVTHYLSKCHRNVKSLQ